MKPAKTDIVGYQLARHPTDDAMILLHYHFISVLRQYAEELEWQDFPWRYGERPLVGMLAAAVWKAGGVALEEYWMAKQSEGDESHGRNDLYFKLLGKHFLCEAKHDYINLTDGIVNSREQIHTVLRKADDSCEKVIANRNEMRFALAFVSFRKTKNRLKNAEETIRNCVKDLSDIENTFVSWYFPWRQIHPGRRRKEDEYYYGVVMLMREFKGS